MWWNEIQAQRSAGLVVGVIASGALWWALYAAGVLWWASMVGAFALVCAAGIGLERGEDRQIWAWVMLAALCALLIGAVSV